MFKQNSLRMFTDMHRYAIFTNITNNIIIMFNSRSVLENPFVNDLLILFLYLWVPILLDKEAWNDIESYFLFSVWTGLCLVKVL